MGPQCRSVELHIRWHYKKQPVMVSLGSEAVPLIHTIDTVVIKQGELTVLPPIDSLFIGHSGKSEIQAQSGQKYGTLPVGPIYTCPRRHCLATAPKAISFLSEGRTLSFALSPTQPYSCLCDIT